MRFSIITATYNAGAQIARCVESVKTQDFSGVEHILVDNCSADGTVELARKANPALKTIVEPDTGIYNAMNKGLRIAENECIACLNSDDSYLPGTLRLVSEIFAVHPEVDIVHGNIIVKDRECRPVSGASSFKGSRIYHPAAFIRRSLFSQLGLFDERYRICADLDFFLKAKLGGVRFYHIDKPLTVFALGGISTREWRMTSLEIRRILEQYRFPKWFVAGYSCASYLRRQIALCARFPERFSSKSADR